MLFDERTKGHIVPKFRRPKKDKVGSSPLSDGSCSSSTSATTSLSMSSSCESLGSGALPSLPARPSFAVGPVAHKAMSSLEVLAANYDSIPLSPLSFMGEDMEDIYLPDLGLGDAGVKWPVPDECPTGPCDFSHLLPLEHADEKGSVASTLADEDASCDDLLSDLKDFVDEAERDVEYISYADTLVPLDTLDSPNKASFVPKFFT